MTKMPFSGHRPTGGRIRTLSIMAETPETIEVLQGLIIFDATVEGDEVLVDLYGGEESVFGSVRFSFPDRSERNRRLAALRSWRDAGLPVTFVAHDDIVTLVSEHELLADAFPAGVGLDA